MFGIKLDVVLLEILFRPLPLKERLQQALKLVCETLPTLDVAGAVYVREHRHLKKLVSWCAPRATKTTSPKGGGEPNAEALCADQNGRIEPSRISLDLPHRALTASQDGYLDVSLPDKLQPSGMLRFRTVPGKSPSPEEVEALWRVAAFIALFLALEQAEHEKQGAVQRATLLARAVETIASAHREDAVTQRLCEQLAAVGGYDLVVMYGNKTTGEEMRPIAAAGTFAAAVRAACSSTHLQPSNAWKAVLDGQTHFFENALEELASTPLAPLLPKEQRHSAVAIPYRVDGRVGGALFIVADNANGSLLDSVDVLSLIARVYAEARSHQLSRDNFELFRAVVEQSPESVLITDTTGKAVYCNRAFSQETGYRKDEVLGKTPQILKSGAHDDAFYQRLWDTLSSGNVFTAVFTNKKKSGELYKTSRVIAPVKVGETSYYVAFGGDITGEDQLKSELATVLNALPHPVIKVGVDGRLLHFNQAAGEIFGLRQDHKGLLLKAVLGDWFLKVSESVDRALLNDPPPPMRIVRGNRVFMLYAQPIPSLSGSPIAAAAVFVDVTSLEEESVFRQALLQLSKDVVREGRPYQRILEFAVRHTPGAAAGSLLVGGGRKPFVFKALVGYSRKLLNHKMPARLRWPAGRSGPEIYRVTDEVRSRIRSEYPMLYKMGRIGEISEVLTAVVPLSDNEFIVFNLDAFQPNAFDRVAIERMGLLANSLGYFLSWKHQKERSAHIAYHDELTGLPNRKYLMDLAPRILARAKRGEPVCIMKIDVTNLNNINNLLGTRAGDKALKAVARRLESTLYEGDLLTRTAGDEFIAVLPKCDAAGARTAAARVLRRMKEPFDIHRRIIPVRIVIGVSVAPGDGSNLDELLRKAGLAILRAMEEGAELAFYDPDLEKELRVHQAVEIELEAALSKNEMELFVQPILDLENNRYAHFEILLRWKFPPTAFVPVAEQTGLGPTMDAYVLKRAEPLARLLKRPVFVNLLPSTLKDGLPEFPDPSLVGFEITEHGLVKPEAVEQAKRLASLGYRLALDDFGTKYSNLALLAELPLNFVKIDRSLVSRALETGDAKGKALFEGLVAAVGRVGMNLVAEGIEDETYLHYLRSVGVRYAQGYGIAKPGPPSRFT